MPRKSSKQISKQVSNPKKDNYLGKIESEINSNQSKVSLVLGALIILVIGILVFNYFNKSQPSLGPAQQTEQEQQLTEDIALDKLPGKYTVKEDDTLFLIAQKYYNDGDKFTEIVKANNLADANVIEKDQVIEIPKLADVQAIANPDETPSPSPSPSPILDTSTPANNTENAIGGGDATVWGSKIEGDTYTIEEGDWLSTISARSYGDIYSYKKIADANNISDPDYITPGTVLKIPR